MNLVKVHERTKVALAPIVGMNDQQRFAWFGLDVLLKRPCRTQKGSLFPN